MAFLYVYNYSIVYNNNNNNTNDNNNNNNNNIKCTHPHHLAYKKTEIYVLKYNSKMAKKKKKYK